MDKYDQDSVYDSLPRVLEMVADTPSLEAWMGKQGIDKNFLYSCAEEMKNQQHNAGVIFIVATCVAWEVAKR